MNIVVKPNSWPVVMNKFPSRLYNGICGQLGDIPAKVAALLKAPTTWSMVKFAFSSSHRKHLLIDALINGDLSYFSFYYNICENRIYHKILSTANQRLFPEVEVGELYPEVESKYVLKLNGSHVDLELGCQPKPYKIRIKTYKSRDCKNARKLLFQIHGGGFCGFSVDSHEMYLVPYVQRLADVVIVSVDYTLVPKAYFPQQVQECLDVYTWATSPSCPLFEQGLDSVIVTGDSAGGNFAIALVNVLGDIRAQFPEGCPKMPKALVPVYPAASLSGAFHPSLVLASLDAMIGPASLGMIMHDYALPSYGFTMSKFAAQKYDEKVYQLLQHPYVSPLYGDFEKLSDVKLSLISAEGCSLLDQSVDLASRWRGQVTLDVIERAPHGFLNFVNICDQAKDGLGRVVRRFKEGFQHTT
ncbi:Hormone-sensitive lipase [Halotydeus destructor]|nr:Hormone-sensitive lipase [Halotydeus destructor]